LAKGITEIVCRIRTDNENLLASLGQLGTQTATGRRLADTTCGNVIVFFGYLLDIATTTWEYKNI